MNTTFVVEYFFLFFCMSLVQSSPHTNLQLRIQAHKPDQAKTNINGFNMVKSAEQLLYGPVLPVESSLFSKKKFAYNV